MQSKSCTFLALLCTLVIKVAIGQPVYSPSDYRFQHYDMTDGLASESAKEIVQDSLGFLWILYDNGLSRYEVGFSNLPYFSKVFTEKYGILPSEYPTKTI